MEKEFYIKGLHKQFSENKKNKHIRLINSGARTLVTGRYFLETHDQVNTSYIYLYIIFSVYGREQAAHVRSYQGTAGNRHLTGEGILCADQHQMERKFKEVTYILSYKSNIS